MAELGVNIDHVATVRQARRGIEPDPAWAAVEAQLAGCACITMHLREDRRHVQDRDLDAVKAVCEVRLNLEMAATDEMVEICRCLRPSMATLVPEGRAEVTTEGGLDVAGQLDRMRQVVARLQEAGVRPSAFIDAQSHQIQAAAEAGFAVCEIHTGPYAAAFEQHGGVLAHERVAAELGRVAQAANSIVVAGMQFNAGHALNYRNVVPVAALAQVQELHIGHSIVSRAIFTGFREAVASMKGLISQGLG
jgi:pyridoxine 5-phosphate synthase